MPSLEVSLGVSGRATRAHGAWGATHHRSSHEHAARLLRGSASAVTFPRGFSEKVVFFFVVIVTFRLVSLSEGAARILEGSSPFAAAFGRPAVGGAYNLKVEKLSE